MVSEKYEEMRLLARQLDSIASLLVGGHYDFTKQGTTFNFTNKAKEQFVINSFHDGKNYNVVINGPQNNVTRSQFKPVDTAYLGFMMRKVMGTKNYSKDV